MSLKGRIQGLDSTGGEVDQFTEGIGHLKKAANAMFGGALDFENSSDNASSMFIEGIVQGDVKLSATNKWDTTLYYGISDAAGKVGFEGTQASAILKFANTAASAAGYTLGGTGPASKKMYGGSNLNNFTVQFKWYTPYMTGWKEAITMLSFLAWPSAILQGSKVSTPTADPAKKTADDAADTKQRNDILAEIANHDKAIVELQAAGKVFDSSKGVTLTPLTPQASKYADIRNIYQEYLGDHNNSWYDFTGSFENEIGKSVKTDATMKANIIANKDIQMTAADVGSEDWPSASDGVFVNGSAKVLIGGNGIAAPNKTVADAAVKEKLQSDTNESSSVFNVMGNAVAAVKEVGAAIGSIVSGLKDSMAVNPPKVALEIYSDGGKTLQYRFSPLVITAFTVESSRETVNGEPVIVTMDITFDYYMINATNSDKATTAYQKFAGTPIFRIDK